MFVVSGVCLARKMALIAGLGWIALGASSAVASDAAIDTSASDAPAETSASLPASAMEVVAFESCESQTLRIELNVQGKMEKAELLAALKSFTSYPQLIFTPARALSDIAAFHVTLPTACQDGEARNTCAERTGWTEIQLRLKPLRDSRVFCEPSKTPSTKPQAEPLETLPEKIGPGKAAPESAVPEKATPEKTPSASTPAPAASILAPIVPATLLSGSNMTQAFAPSRAPASIASVSDVSQVRILNIEVVQKAHLRSASVNDLNGRSIPLDEIVADPRFAMFAGLKGVRVLKETIRRSSSDDLEYRKAIQLLGRNGEVFRLVTDENLENVQVDPTMGIESAQLDLVSGAVQGVALHLGGEQKRVVVLTVKD